MVVALMVGFGENVKHDACWKGKTVFAFFFNVEADERNALLVVVVFVVHHLEHHLNF